MTTEPIDIRTGKPFTSRRQHLHHPPSDGASLGGIGMAPSARTRGLLGGCFTGCMMAQGKRSDHRVFDWIENTSAKVQFFSTPSPLNQYPFKIEAKLRWTKSSPTAIGENSFFGNYKQSGWEPNTIMLGANGGGFYCYQYGLWYPAIPTVDTDYEVAYEVSNQYVTFSANGASYSKGSGSAVSTNGIGLSVFSGGGNRMYRPALGRIYYAKISVGYELKHFLVPSMQSDEVCLYDEVNDVYLVNAGTSGFVGCNYVDEDIGTYELTFGAGTIIPNSEYANNVKIVGVKPSACTSIGGYAFQGCTSLTSVGDLTACTSIGGSAFQGCAALTSVGDLTACASIGGSAFQGCAALPSVGDLTACTSIGYASFRNCTALTSVGDLTACTSIGDSAFQGCTALTSVGDLTACTSIGDSAFQGCTSLTSVGDLTACASIGNNAFQGCTSLTSVGDLTACATIGSYAFQGCSNLVFNVANLREPANGILNNGIFNGCTQVYGELPRMDNVTTLQASASTSSGCFRYTQVTRIGGFPNATSLGANFFNSCNKIEEIGPFTAFTGLVPSCFVNNCTSLRSISLPNCTGFEEYGMSFTGCRKMRNITLGTCANMGHWYPFSNVGVDNEPDADGIKCTVTVGNTMESWRALPNTSYPFPFAAPTTTKFVCSDGYITYDSSTRTWVNHPTNA